MLSCSDVTELTTDYLDHALPSRRRLAMQWHLAICKYCRRYLRQVRSTIAFLHTMPTAPVMVEREVELVSEMQRVMADQEGGAPKDSG